VKRNLSGTLGTVNSAPLGASTGSHRANEAPAEANYLQMDPT
jgi:hypothetical protein